MASPATQPRLKVTVKYGDLVTEKADVILNPVAPDLNLSCGTLSNAILKGAGKSLQDECNRLKPPHGLHAGHILPTSSGKLGCKAIYHGCFYSYKHGTENQSFRQVVCACMRKASEDRHRSLAMPALGTGMPAYPPEVAGHYIFQEIQAFTQDHKHNSLDEIRIVIAHTDTRTFEVFNRLSRQYEQGQLSGSPASGSPPQTGTASFTQTLAKQDTNQGLELTVKNGDIAKERVDAILNSTSRDLNMNIGAVSQALLRAGGSRLEQECQQKAPRHGLKPGELVSTSGGNLPCKKIYHGSIQRYDQGAGVEGLRKMLKSALAYADEDGYRSLAIPPVGTGNLQYPWQVVAECIFQEVATFSRINQDSSLKDIRVILFKPSSEAVQAFTGQEFEDLSDEEEEGETLGTVIRGVATARISSSNLPRTWKKMSREVQFLAIPLMEDDPEYKEVFDRFLATGGSSDVVQIQRIQNALLYNRYTHLKQQKQKVSSDREEVLYHGTEEGVMDSINSSGFSRAYCSTNGVSLGRGVYFTKTAGAAADDQYARTNNDGYKYVYETMVLVGQYTTGVKDALEPPLKPKTTNLRFDSVVDDVKNPRTYAVFSDSQAYPRYLITFLA